MAIRGLITVCLMVWLAGSAGAQDFLELDLDGGPEVRARLIAKETALTPGRTATVGLWLQMKPGWHTYWQNPGESGLATTLEWELPPGYEAGPIDWPAPQYFAVGGLGSYGYERQIVLPVTINVPADAAPSADADPVTLRARADWLVCREVCKAGGADLNLTLPLLHDADAVEPDPQHLELFEHAERRQPVASPSGGLQAYAGDEGIELSINPQHWPEPSAIASAPVRYFPDRPLVIDMSADQTLIRRDDPPGLRLQLPWSRQGSRPDRLTGVLVVGDVEDGRAYRVDLPLVGAASPTSADPPTSP